MCQRRIVHSLNPKSSVPPEPLPQSSKDTDGLRIEASIAKIFIQGPSYLDAQALIFVYSVRTTDSLAALRLLAMLEETDFECILGVR